MTDCGLRIQRLCLTSHCGRAEPPSHINSPGAQHSAAAKITPQQFPELAGHSLLLLSYKPTNVPGLLIVNIISGFAGKSIQNIVQFRSAAPCFFVCFVQFPSGAKRPPQSPDEPDLRQSVSCLIVQFFRECSGAGIRPPRLMNSEESP